VITYALALLCALGASAASSSDIAALPRIALPGHVLDKLSEATPLPREEAAFTTRSLESLTLTITLRRSDQAGFDRYLHDLYDPDSPTFRHFLTQSAIADMFGPTSEAYQQVLDYLRANGFEQIDGSANRLTLTVRGSRTQTEHAFAVHIGDYRVADKSFYANDSNPTLPPELAARVASVSGLSNIAVPTAPLRQTKPKDVINACRDDLLGLIPGVGLFDAYMHQAQPPQQQDLYDQAQDLISVISSISVVFGNFFALQYFSLPSAVGHCVGFYLGYLSRHPNNFFLRSAAKDKTIEEKLATNTDTTRLAQKLPARDANGQKIGLLEFDTFHPSDVRDWLSLIHANPTFANHLIEVHVNGGVGSPGAGEPEVLLDIATVMIADPSLNTDYVVYDAPPSTSFQQLLNVMINDGVTVISNSWTECEDQHTLAEVQSVDSILAQAAAGGITVVNGSGDTGTTCLDGAPNTIGVPANSPHSTAVGGTSPTFGSGFTYGTETWWDGSGEIPATGQGGFGVSRYFARPSYQNGFNASATRSVPDVAVPADPRAGLSICQADAGGCPTGLLYGGTSMAAPMMAGMVAYLNEQLGSNIGQLNPAIYPLAGTNAFHSASSMGSDFGHVGLGSPKFDNLLAHLASYAIGAVDPATSAAGGTLLSVADGTTPAVVRINLTDANHFSVAGKIVSLTPNAGSHAVVSAPSGPSDDTDGAVIFTITDAITETVTFTVTDTTDGITLTRTPKVTFVTPPAASAGITALPSSVPADGTSMTTITVTLKDALNRPTPGKAITISQGAGHSIITGPSPAVTDATGQIQFTATNNVAETVTYTAVDVTDGDLPIPGSPSVTFTGGSSSCVGSPPTAAPGFSLTPFANGFVARNFFYSNVNWGGCPGASNPAFDSSGNVLVSDFANGNLYKFGAAGGAVSNANVLSNLGLTLSQPVFGKDGNLYAPRGATGANQFSGNILQIDPASGSVIKIVVSGLTCPSPLGVDPLSGDLFFTDNCFGAGADNPSLWRVVNPSSASPTLTVYATLPATPNGATAFAPDGTIYVVTAYNGAGSIVRVSGTDKGPPTMTTLSGISSDFWITMGEVQANGAAKSLLVHSAGALKLVDITTNPFTTSVLVNGNVATGSIGPDGCLYLGASDTIYKLLPSSGGCGFSPTNPSPALTLAPATVSPNPAQGGSQTMTAAFKNISVPAGTPVLFNITGANAQPKIATTDLNGTATITYAGVFAGADTITATATVGSSTFTSNAAHLTWSTGKHVTFLTLNLSPSGGMAGQPITVTGSLVDVSATPSAAIAGATIHFSLGTQTCDAITNAQGNASCALVVPPRGPVSLTASFAGDAQYVAASTAEAFIIAAPAQLGGPGDLVYKAVEPCRIMDTRNATVGSGVQGPISGAVLKQMPGYVAAGANWGTYGGNPASDCGLTNPPGTSIVGVAVVITILNPNFDAFLGVSDSSDLNTTLSTVALNYTHGQGLSTMYMVPQVAGNTIYFAMPAGLSAQLIFDVVGYYVSSDATALQCTTQSSAAATITGSGGMGSATSPACGAGYTLMSGQCDSDSFNMKLVSHEATAGNTAWFCSAVNSGGSDAHLTATANCCRIPGK